MDGTYVYVIRKVKFPSLVLLYLLHFVHYGRSFITVKENLEFCMCAQPQYWVFFVVTKTQKMNKTDHSLQILYSTNSSTSIE